MAKQEYFELGTLSKPHGIKGALHVYLDVDDPYDYEGLKSIFVQVGNDLIPYFIDDLQVRSNLNLISLEGISSIDQAKDLVGCKLFLPISFLPKLKEDQYYYHEVVGYRVVDANLGSLGLVREIYSTGAQDVIVMIYKSKEILIPLTDEIVPKVDKKNAVVQTNLPDGLLEVYLDDEN